MPISVLSRVGGLPALDFLNSIFVDRGEAIDLIGDGQAMRAWLKSSGVLPPRADADLAAWTPADFERLARNARALRQDLRQFLFLRAGSSGFDSSKQDVSFVNRRMAKTGLVHVLVAGDDRWELTVRHGATSPAVVLSELAIVCADLIANCSSFQIRKCEHPACTMWFYDNRQGPPRRWCSMLVCGNRAKATTHRRRVRATAAEPGMAGRLTKTADPPEHLN